MVAFNLAAIGRDNVIDIDGTAARALVAPIIVRFLRILGDSLGVLPEIERSRVLSQVHSCVAGEQVKLL